MWSKYKIKHELAVYSQISFTGNMVHVDTVVEIMLKMQDEMQAELQKVQRQLHDALKERERMLDQKYEMTDRIGELVGEVAALKKAVGGDT